MREITTQKELDMLTKVKAKEEVVISGSGLKLNGIIDVFGCLRIETDLRMSFSEEKYIIARGNSLVVARAYARVAARGNASVVARGNASVVVWGNRQSGRRVKYDEKKSD